MIYKLITNNYKKQLEIDIQINKYVNGKKKYNE